jgi:DNA-binding transcriptional ArsR family regulator
MFMDKPSPEELELLHSELCGAISDTTRIAIMYELVDGPLNVSSVVSALRLPQGTVSRHMKILRDSGMVRATRDGNRVYYELKEKRIIKVLNMMRNILADALGQRIETADRIRTAHNKGRK